MTRDTHVTQLDLQMYHELHSENSIAEDYSHCQVISPFTGTAHANWSQLTVILQPVEYCARWAEVRPPLSLPFQHFFHSSLHPPAQGHISVAGVSVSNTAYVV